MPERLDNTKLGEPIRETGTEEAELLREARWRRIRVLRRRPCVANVSYSCVFISWSGVDADLDFCLTKGSGELRLESSNISRTDASS